MQSLKMKLFQTSCRLKKRVSMYKSQTPDNMVGILYRIDENDRILYAVCKLLSNPGLRMCRSCVDIVQFNIKKELLDSNSSPVSASTPDKCFTDTICAAAFCGGARTGTAGDCRRTVVVDVGLAAEPVALGLPAGAPRQVVRDFPFLVGEIWLVLPTLAMALQAYSLIGTIISASGQIVSESTSGCSQA